MAIVGRTEIRPRSTTSQATYTVLVCRCLLCGRKTTYTLSKPLVDGGSVVPFCDCYGDNLLEPVRMIPNDKGMEEHSRQLLGSGRASG